MRRRAQAGTNARASPRRRTGDGLLAARNSAFDAMPSRARDLMRGSRMGTGGISTTVVGPPLDPGSLPVGRPTRTPRQDPAGPGIRRPAGPGTPAPRAVPPDPPGRGTLRASVGPGSGVRSPSGRARTECPRTRPGGTADDQPARPGRDRAKQAGRVAGEPGSRKAYDSCRYSFRPLLWPVPFCGPTPAGARRPNRSPRPGAARSHPSGRRRPCRRLASAPGVGGNRGGYRSSSMPAAADGRANGNRYRRRC